MGLRDHRPSHFSKPGQAEWQIVHPLPPPSAPSQGASRGVWAAPLGKGSDVKRQEARWAGKERKEERREEADMREAQEWIAYSGPGFFWGHGPPLSPLAQRISAHSWARLRGHHFPKPFPSTPPGAMRLEPTPIHSSSPLPQPPGAMAESEEEILGRRIHDSKIFIPICCQG